jgi:tetratricopeptide (TPR) repeat protein
LAKVSSHFLKGFLATSVTLTAQRGLSTSFIQTRSYKIDIMHTQPQGRPDWLRIGLIALALSYALLAGLHTVSDFDIGWQLATGRYLVQHHEIPRVDHFSYTAQGKEWIYPPFSGVIFYLLYLAGGYSALSWLNAFACAATVACLIAVRGRLVTVLAIIAVPAIAFRTVPRADLFTTVLFAAVLAIIWRNNRGKPVRLWLLPVIIGFWANMHLGFIAGLGLLGAGVFFELCAMLFADRRAAAFLRLKALLPWIGVSFAATLVNPWGLRLYEGLYRQNSVVDMQTALIGEWTTVHFNSLALLQALNARDPASGDWWLLGVGALAILVALWKRNFGPAVLLAAGMALSIEHIRFQVVFACLAVVVGGTLLGDFAGELVAWSELKSKVARDAGSEVSSHTISPRFAYLISATLIIFVGLRITDLITDRYYIDAGQLALFGTGPSWWFPERATAFLMRETLPGNVFHDFGLGGYLTWRIGPQYPDFVDGRYVPFGDKLLSEQRLLASLGPDSPEWQQAAERWQINTAIFSVARYAGLGTFPLQDFCASNAWKPVYLDDVAVIFVRNRPENAGLIQRLGIRCESAPIAPPDAASGESFRARAERFNYLMNTASIDFVLSRDAEAASTITQAEQIFPDNPNLHLVKAQMFAATNRPDDAEREYLRVLQIYPSDAAWFALARLYSSEHRYPDAVHCVQKAASLSPAPFEHLRSEGLLYLAMKQPQDALAAFGQAERASPYRDESSDLGKQFNAQIAEGRARAYGQLNEVDRAVAEQKLAANLSPENPARWAALADLYAEQGQTADSSQARLRAQSIQDAAKHSANTKETDASR